MKNVLALTVTALSLSFSAAPDPLAADAEAAPPTVAALKNVYDAAVVRSSTGEVLTIGQAADELSRVDVVFFGEIHGHPGNHLAQMQVFQAMHERYPDMTLSLEQFERDTQPAVDGYLAGEIGEKELQEEGRAWDNYEQSYRPLVEYAKHNQLPVIASNAPKNIVICVGKEGPEILDHIPQPDRSWVAAELHLDDGEYMDKFLEFITESSTHGPSKEDMGTDEADEEVVVPEIPEAMRPMVMRSFSAQVTRDDTMAESIAQHMQQHPGRKVLHLNGDFHSASHLGTVERLKTRMPDLKIAVISPIEVEDNNAPAWTGEDSATGDYLLLIQALPSPFVSEERKLEYEREVMAKRMGNTCEYGVDPEA